MNTDNKILEWNTGDIIQGEIDYRKSDDEEVRKEIATLYTIARKQVTEIVDRRIESAKENIKLVSEKYLNKNGSLNEPLARKDTRKTELKRLLALADERIEKDLFSRVSEDSYIFEDAYESLTEALTDFMENLPDYTGKWTVTVTNFGWRNQNGHMTFDAETGQELLRKILPDTECTYKIFTTEDKKGFSIQNFHHDSPTGNEWYHIFPAKEEDEE